MINDQLNYWRIPSNEKQDPRLIRIAASCEGIVLPKGIRKYIRKEIAKLRKDKNSERLNIEDKINLVESLRDYQDIFEYELREYRSKLEELIGESKLTQKDLHEARTIIQPKKRLKKYKKLYKKLYKKATQINEIP